MATKKRYIDINNPSEEERRAMRSLMKELFGDDDNDDDDDLFVDQEGFEKKHNATGRQTANSKSTDHGISTFIGMHAKLLASPTRRQHSPTRKGAAIKVKAPRGKKYEYIDVSRNDDHPTTRRGGADGLDFLSSDKDPYDEDDSTFKFVQQGPDKLATPDRSRITRIRNDPIIFSLGDSTTSGALNRTKHHRLSNARTNDDKSQTAKEGKDTTNGKAGTITLGSPASPYTKSNVSPEHPLSKRRPTLKNLSRLPINSIPPRLSSSPEKRKRKRKTGDHLPADPFPQTPKRSRPNNRIALLNSDASPVQIREDNELNFFAAVERLISSSVKAQGRMFGDPVFNLRTTAAESRDGNAPSAMKSRFKLSQVGKGRTDSAISLSGQSMDGSDRVRGDIIVGWKPHNGQMTHGICRTAGGMSTEWEAEGRACGAGTVQEDIGYEVLIDDNAAATILSEMRLDLRGGTDV